jgi:preprotein translocase subunit SecG
VIAMGLLDFVDFLKELTVILAVVVAFFILSLYLSLRLVKYLESVDRER